MNIKVFVEHIEAGAMKMGVPVSRLQAERMAIHGKELLEWNKVSNITAITDLKELAEKQFLDVLPLAGEIPSDADLIDIGSGGGFPGLPLKILRSDLNVMLIDGRRKRVSFLKHAIRAMGIDGVDARHIRAENLQKEGKKHGEHIFDVVVSKAVGDLGGLVEIGTPLLGARGTIISMKGAQVKKELKGLGEKAALIGFSTEMKKYFLPFSALERNLVLFRR